MPIVSLKPTTPLNSKPYISREEIRNLQSFTTGRCFNALDHGEIVEHVQDFISKNSHNIDGLNFDNQSILNFIALGVKDFLKTTEHPEQYAHLQSLPETTAVVEQIVAKEQEKPREFAPVDVSHVPALKHLTPKFWEPQNAGSANNNCGIFSMFPKLIPEEAQQKRDAFLQRLEQDHEAGTLTYLDYQFMHANLPQQSAHRMSHNQIFEKYKNSIENGGYLDPFALSRIAKENGKHVIILSLTNRSDCNNTLRKIYSQY
ncbi:MAG: hypothetical protein V4591_09235, partial [Bdellovibrionota bacterium]